MNTTKKIVASVCVVLVLFCCFLTLFPENRYESINSVSDAEETECVKIALISFNPEYHKKVENINRLSEYVEEAAKAGAKIIVAPELVTDDYFIGKNDVLNYSGVRNLIVDFAEISETADIYDAYVCFGYPEITSDEHLYNSAALIGPDGAVLLETRKHAIPSWNEVGNLEPSVCTTPYGDIGVVICADSYTASNVKELCDLGADIILSPVTWYGDAEQFETWTSRAKENGIWFIACNRWGVEWSNYDNDYVDMSDAPCAIIDTSGNVVLCYTEDHSGTDCILYYDMPISRISA